MGRTIFGMPPAKEVFAASVAATDVPMNLRRFMRDLLVSSRFVSTNPETRMVEKRPASESRPYNSGPKMNNERRERVYPSRCIRGRQKKGDAWKKSAPPRGGQGEKSEVEAQTELHTSSEVSAARVQEAGRAGRISGSRANWSRAHNATNAFVLQGIEEV